MVALPQCLLKDSLYGHQISILKFGVVSQAEDDQILLLFHRQHISHEHRLHQRHSINCH